MGLFLAVDRSNPDTVYAATEGGLCKSTDAGETWVTLPRTDKSDLRITGEKNKSIHSVAVDPSNGSNVYATSPLGKVYKSTDGGRPGRSPMRKRPRLRNLACCACSMGR